MKLTTEKVEKIFLDCLFKDTEIVEGKPNIEPVKVKGIVNSFGFHPKRLDGYKDQITELLAVGAF